MGRIIGYGTTTFDADALRDGVIVRPEILAESLLKLFNEQIIGNITTRRVALTIPFYRAFSRMMELPQLSAGELDEAVRLEMEQYISLALGDLYMDYAITRKTAEGINVRAVAVPKTIVDSYLTLARMAGLETMAIETTIGAAARLFRYDSYSDLPSVIVDFGSLTADISIFHKTTLVTGTVPAGGLVFTDAIKSGLGLTEAEAGVVKTKYGMGVSKKQQQIVASLQPALEKLIKEIRRMIRYHEEHYGGTAIGQVVILGGGANMPGLGDYLTSALRLPVRVENPWKCLSYKGMQVPRTADMLMYATVAGLSLIDTEEIFE